MSSILKLLSTTRLPPWLHLITTSSVPAASVIGSSFPVRETLYVAERVEHAADLEAMLRHSLTQSPPNVSISKLANLVLRSPSGSGSPSQSMDAVPSSQPFLSELPVLFQLIHCFFPYITVYVDTRLF